jgi:hypothetical protein
MFTFPVAHFGGELSFTIDQSIRFNDDDSPFLHRSPSGAGSATTMTWSYWVKRAANFGANNWMFGSFSGSLQDQCFFNTSDQLNFSIDVGSSRLTTSRVFRDPAAWFHVLLVWDSTNGTSGDRMRMYINGDRQTDFATETYPSSSASAPRWNTTNQMEIGRSGFSGQHGDMYMAEFNFLDGIAVTDASDFGETNAVTGQWIPKEYTGSYGTNGFRITGADSSDLGEDFSGNGNDFSSSGLTSADSVSDSPTANHCTLNPLWVDGYTLSDGNLVTNQSGDAAAIGTMAFDPTDSQGFYFEAKVTTAASFPNVGIRTAESCSQVGAVSSLSGNSTGRFAYTGSNGQFNDEGSGSSYGSTWAGTADKVIGVFVKAGELFFSVDGTIQNSGTAAKTGLTGLMVPTVFYDAGSGTQAQWEMRFDASDWSTTPTAYKAISTANLTDTTITTSGTFTGNASADGPFVYLNGVPTAMTINGNSVTFATHADKLSNGFKVRTSSSSYNASGSNSYSISTTGAAFADNANAQGNP